MTNITKLLDKCERMAKHSFVQEALDIINNPFDEVKYDEATYIKAASKAVTVDYKGWTYEISGNIPHILQEMKKYTQKAIKFNKYSSAINELYFLALLQNAPIEKYKYLVFAYGQVPHYEKYKFHFKNQNDGYIMCANPLMARDVIGLAERIKQHLPN